MYTEKVLELDHTSNNYTEDTFRLRKLYVILKNEHTRNNRKLYRFESNNIGIFNYYIKDEVSVCVCVVFLVCTSCYYVYTRFGFYLRISLCFSSV